MCTQSKYRVVFYINTKEEFKNLITGTVSPKYYIFEILKNLEF